MSTPTPPDHDQLNKLFNSACEAHMSGNLTHAREQYMELLSYVPAPLVWYNLGLVHYELKEIDQALHAFEKAAQGAPEDSDTLFNLALCYKECARYDEAIRMYKKVLELDQENIDALYNLAGCYRAAKEIADAIEHYLHVLERDANHSSALNNIAYLYQLIGETDKALFYYRKLIAVRPDDEAAQHMLNSLEGNTPDSSPESYVKDIFDNYSDSYEKSLVDKLHYSVPAQIRTLLEQLLPSQHKFSQGLDLGCGTGLSGEPFADLVIELTGIDLSEKMIDIARKKKIYTSLCAGNIINYLNETKQSPDFILAADVFNYLGKLDTLFAGIRRVSAPGALFCFSTEHSEEKAYILRSTGRFAHSPGYINSLAKRNGFVVRQQENTRLRMERGEWIYGDLWILEECSPK